MSVKSENIKSPVEKGVVRVPVIMQLEELECGAASLCMILAYYNKWMPIEEVRSMCGVSRDGVSARNILRAARYYGLDVAGYRCGISTLFDDVTYPCIAFVNNSHFVVICGTKKGKIHVNDPAKGSCRYDEEEFAQIFSGVIMQFEPTDKFEPEGKPKSMLSFAKKRLKGTGTAIAFTGFTAVIASLVSLMNPAFSRVFVDYLLPGENPRWVIPFLFLLAAFSLVQVIMTALQSIYALRINGKMAVVGNSTFMWKILKMPIEFFSQRRAGDIQQRQASNATIAASLIQTFAPLMLNCGMMIFYLAVMLRYSWVLTLVGIISMTVSALVSRYISAKRVNITRVSMKELANLASTTVIGIDMIESLKATGAEKGFFTRWAGIQANANAQQIRFSKTDIYMSMIPQFVTTVTNYIILLQGVWFIMAGDFTVGKVMAFQGFLGSFMTPALTLISAGQTLQEMRTSMERVDDVMEYSDEDIFAHDEGACSEDKIYEKLSGRVEIKDIVFGYNTLADPLIRNFSMTLEPGKSVAIVGDSGCGKSTISKLVSGLYQPWSGEILFDGKPLCQLSKSVFRESLSVVDQDIVLFEDTIAENIRLWDESIDDVEIIRAAKDAQFHNDIMERPHGYNWKLNEEGRDLSGGQRQKLEIARVLATRPSIIIMDEATSALDAKTEYEVVKAVRARNISCIMIAHRLSTIRSCDEIIVMEKGEIKDRGTHDELMKTSEIYKKLVSIE